MSFNQITATHTGRQYFLNHEKLISTTTVLQSLVTTRFFITNSQQILSDTSNQQSFRDQRRVSRFLLALSRLRPEEIKLLAQQTEQNSTPNNPSNQPLSRQQALQAIQQHEITLTYTLLTALPSGLELQQAAVGTITLRSLKPFLPWLQAECHQASKLHEVYNFAKKLPELCKNYPFNKEVLTLLAATDNTKTSTREKLEILKRLIASLTDYKKSAQVILASLPPEKKRTSDKPLFPVSLKLHKIANGETILSIANKYKITVYDIVHANPNLRNINATQLGQDLYIPSKDKGLVVIIEKPTTLAQLARRYDANLAAVMLTNHSLSPTTLLIKGDMVLLPDVFDDELSERTYLQLQNREQDLDTNIQTDRIVEFEIIPGHHPPIKSRSGLLVTTSGFGPRISPFTRLAQFHNGIDIPASSGTPIYSTEAGRVVANGNFHPIWGNFIAIQSLNSQRVFFYAHLLNPPELAVDTQVNPGTPLGAVGSTGASTGPHLHFSLFMYQGPGEIQDRALRDLVGSRFLSLRGYYTPTDPTSYLKAIYNGAIVASR